ncbi:hypothetical protein BVX97_06495 [bacterium E08(2017)]|nr:hypothetical protein BVX97_06495 [bacterium E08(2017)]
MRRLGLFIVGLYLLAASFSSASELWFPVGEQLVHKIYWGFIPVGSSVTTSRIIENEGKKLIMLRVRTKTNNLFDKIRKVDDVVESFIEPVTFLPVSFRRRMIRNNSMCDEYSTFDYEKQECHWENHCTGEKKTFPIKRDTRDILTFLYFFRRFELTEESESEYQVMADNAVHAVKVRTGKGKGIKLPLYGEVQSVKIDPAFDFDGLLIDKGKFRLWVSDDDRKLLTKIIIKQRLADIRIVLQTVAGPGEDAWVSPSDLAKHKPVVMNDKQVEQYL